MRAYMENGWHLEANRGTFDRHSQVKFCVKRTHFTSVEEVQEGNGKSPEGPFKNPRSRTVASNVGIECRSG
ncbi:hypothetical protein TNCV_1003761 [Trichonephila clavipes]|nr:hypothetical protein TNCV_1003761 [Trichonephila clavipes]